MCHPIIQISNIGLFSIAPCKVITLNPLCILFCISSLLFFDGPLSKVHFKGDSAKRKRVTTIAIAIVGRAITIWEAIQKRILQNSYKNLSKEIKSDNFCYRKVGRTITKWGTIEKSPILLSQYWKITIFKR